MRKLQHVLETYVLKSAFKKLVVQNEIPKGLFFHLLFQIMSRRWWWFVFSPFRHLPYKVCFYWSGLFFRGFGPNNLKVNNWSTRPN